MAVHCEFISGCPFFQHKMAQMPATADIYRKTYCRGNPEACARLLVRRALGPENVPPDLMPNQTERAQALLGAAAPVFK